MMQTIPSTINNRFTQPRPRSLGIFLAISATLFFSACNRKPEAAKNNSESSTQKEATQANRYLFPIKVESKWGFIDQAGAVVIEPRFFGVGQFSEGLAPVWVDAHPSDVTASGFAGGKWGYIDHSGSFSIAPQFDDAADFSDGRAAVVVGAREISYSTTRMVVTESGYYDGKIGFINTNGKFVVSPRFLPPDFRQGMRLKESEFQRSKYVNKHAVVQPPNVNWHFLQSESWPTQNVLLKSDSSYIPAPDGLRIRDHLSDGRIVVEKRDEKRTTTGAVLVGYADENLNVVIPLKYEWGHPFNEGLAAVCEISRTTHEFDTYSYGYMQKCGFIDTSGEYKVPPIYTYAQDFSEGLAAVRFRDSDGNGGFGYVEKSGIVAIKPQFDDVRNFHGGLAATQVGNKWGYINKTGSFVINPQYSQAGDFINGLALVDDADYIDTTGKYVFRASDNALKTSSDVATKPLATSVSGSAFFVNKDGFLVTNHHVVAECVDIHIANSTEALELVASDPLNDLALLKSQNSEHDFARFRFDNSLPQGEEIIAFGYPLSGLLSSGGSVSVGTVSATKGPRGISSLFQFDAAIQPGSSGGPVLDRKGNVVGLVVGKLDPIKFAALTGSIPENVNFAITASTVTGFLSANNINFTKPPMIAFHKDTEQLATLAKSFSISIQCTAHVSN